MPGPGWIPRTGGCEPTWSGGRSPARGAARVPARLGGLAVRSWRNARSADPQAGCPQARPEIRAACGAAVPSPSGTVSADVSGPGSRCVGQSSAALDITLCSGPS